MAFPWAVLAGIGLILAAGFAVALARIVPLTVVAAGVAGALSLLIEVVLWPDTMTAVGHVGFGLHLMVMATLYAATLARRPRAHWVLALGVVANALVLYVADAMRTPLAGEAAMVYSLVRAGGATYSSLQILGLVLLALPPSRRWLSSRNPGHAPA